MTEEFDDAYYVRHFENHKAMDFGDDFVLQPLFRENFDAFAAHFFTHDWRDHCDFERPLDATRLAGTLFDDEVRTRLILWQVFYKDELIGYAGYRLKFEPILVLLPIRPDLDWTFVLDNTEVLVGVMTAFFYDCPDKGGLHAYLPMPIDTETEERLCDLGFERDYFYHPEHGDTPEGRKLQTEDPERDFVHLIPRNVFLGLYFEEAMRDWEEVLQVLEAQSEFGSTSPEE